MDEFVSVCQDDSFKSRIAMFNNNGIKKELPADPFQVEDPFKSDLLKGQNSSLTVIYESHVFMLSDVDCYCLLLIYIDFFLFSQIHLEKILSKKTIPSREPHLTTFSRDPTRRTCLALEILSVENPHHQLRYDSLFLFLFLVLINVPFKCSLILNVWGICKLNSLFILSVSLYLFIFSRAPLGVATHLHQTALKRRIQVGSLCRYLNMQSCFYQVLSAWLNAEPVTNNICFYF